MVICKKCGKEGRLFIRPTFSKGKMYHYKYVSHYDKSQVKSKSTINCCNGKSSKEEYEKERIRKYDI